jgi:hypothetical protein
MSSLAKSLSQPPQPLCGHQKAAHELGHKMDIKEFCLTHEFDMSKCAVTSGGGSFTMTELKTSPVEFLSLAEDDFVVMPKRSFVAVC